VSKRLHRSIVFGVLLVFSSVGVRICRSSEVDKATKCLYVANAYFNRGLYDLAVPEYRRFLKQYPNHPKADEARFALGICLYNQSKLNEAAGQFETVAGKKNFAHAVEARCLLGQCRLALGDYKSAEESFRRVVENAPGNEMADDAAAGLAETFIARKKWKEAAEQYENLIRRWPKSLFVERALFQAAVARIHLADFEKARAHLEAFLGKKPDSPLAQQAEVLLGDCWRETGKPQKAIEHYGIAAHKLKGDFRPDALLGLAVSYFLTSNYDKAVEAANELRRDFPKSPLLRTADFYRARALIELKLYKVAEPVLASLAAKDDDITDDALYWRARCLAAMRKDAEAEKILSQALDKYPKSDLRPAMLLELGRERLALGRFNEAAADFDRLVSKYPKSDLVGEARRLACFALHRAGRYDESLKRCERFLKENPKSRWAEEVELLAAENLFLSKNYAEAAKRYDAFIRRYPKSKQLEKARLRRGAAFHAQGRYDEAVEALKDLADRPTTDPVLLQSRYIVADALFQQRKFKEAIPYLRSFVGGAARRAPNRDDALLKLAVALRETGDRNGAVAAFDKLVGECPASPLVARALFEAGQTFFDAKDYAKAAERFGAVLERKDSPSTLAAAACYNLGCIAAGEKKWNEAAGWFARVAGKFPAYERAADARVQQAVALIKTGRFKDAEAILRKFLEKHPDHKAADLARFNLGFALAKTGRDREAADQFEQLLKRSPKSPLADRALYEAAWAYKRLKRADRARSAYRRLLERFPRSSLADSASLELAELEFEAKNYDAAVALLEPLVGRVKDADLRQRALYRLGWCRFERGEFDRAAEQFERLVKEYPKSSLAPAADYQAGEALFRTKQFERAAAHYERIVRQYPKFNLYQESMVRLAECQARLERFAESQKTCSDFLAKFPASKLAGRARFDLGWALENQKRYGEAIAAYRKVVESGQGDEVAARAQFQIGECLFAQGRLPEAAAELLKVEILYSYPKWSARALLEAGRVLEKMGKIAEARARYEELRAKYPKTDEAKVAEKRLSQLAKR